MWPVFDPLFDVGELPHPAVEVGQLGKLVHVQLHLEASAQQLHHIKQKEISPSKVVTSKELSSATIKSALKFSQNFVSILTQLLEGSLLLVSRGEHNLEALSLDVTKCINDLISLRSLKVVSSTEPVLTGQEPEIK